MNQSNSTEKLTQLTQKESKILQKRFGVDSNKPSPEIAPPPPESEDSGNGGTPPVAIISDEPIDQSSNNSNDSTNTRS